MSRDPGIKVDSSWTYKASFYYRFPASSSFSGTLTAGLRTNGGTVLAQATTQIRGTATSWTKVNLDLRPTTSAPDNDNSFFISVDGAAAAGQTINFALLSLFPPTFKNRPNGMRIDIAEVRVLCTRQNGETEPKLALIDSRRNGPVLLPLPRREQPGKLSLVASILTCARTQTLFYLIGGRFPLLL